MCRLFLQFHVTAGARPSECPGYVHTSSSSSSSHETVYAMDCEMCYTTAGLELTRVSIVDMSLKPVLESIVVPPHPIVDYNTRYIHVCVWVIECGCDCVCV